MKDREPKEIPERLRLTFDTAPNVAAYLNQLADESGGSRAVVLNGIVEDQIRINEIAQRLSSYTFLIQDEKGTERFRFPMSKLTVFLRADPDLLELIFPKG